MLWFNNLFNSKQLFHPLYTFPARSVLRPIKISPILHKILLTHCKIKLKMFILSPNPHPFRYTPTNLLNHSQMLIIFMRRKQQFPRIKLNNNTSNTPNITYFSPSTASQNNFRCSILSSINYIRMILVFKSGPPKVYYLNNIALWFVILLSFVKTIVLAAISTILGLI